MKRPLAIIGFSALCIMLCLINFESTLISLCLLIASAVIVLILFNSKSKQALPCAMVFIGIGLACFLFMVGEYQRQTTLQFCGEDEKVTAVVCEEPEFSHENGRFYALVRVKSIEGKRAYGKMRLSFSETYDGIDAEKIKIGDRISFDAKVYKIGSANDDIHGYYTSIGVFTGAYKIKNMTVENPVFRPFSFYTAKVRNYIFDTVNRSFDSETAGVIIAILTGEKSYCDEGLYSDFKRSGAAHIMAVSGMHLSVWILFIGYLFEKMGRYRKMSNIIMCLTVFFIMLLSCFSASVMRAGAMVLLHLIGRFIGRESDGLNSLGFASIALLVLNPYIAINVGFQLSFMSVASIFILALPFIEFTEEKLINKLSHSASKKLLFPVASSLWISFSVSVFTFPIMAIIFGGVSLVSPLTNLLLLPVATPFMVLSGAFSAFSFVPVLSSILKAALKISASYIISSVEFTAGIPNSYIPVSSRHMIAWAAFTLLILFSALMMIRKRLLISKLSFAAVALAFTFSLLNHFSTSLLQYKITPIITQNDCSYVVSMNGRGVLVGMSEDYYFSKTLAETVERLGISLDCAVFFEDTDTYQSGFICQEHNIEYIINENGESIKLFGIAEIGHKGDRVEVTGNGIKTEIFMKEYLQKQNQCDIMMNKYGLIFPEREGEPQQYIIFSEETAGLSLAVDEDGEFTFGG